jgi:hypothetical protein
MFQNAHLPMHLVIKAYLILSIQPHEIHISTLDRGRFTKTGRLKSLSPLVEMLNLADRTIVNLITG